MSDPFSSEAIYDGGSEENFQDDVTTATGDEQQLVDVGSDVVLKYGTEEIIVSLQDERYAGKTLSEISALVADDLGFRSGANLNYRAAGTFVEGATVPSPGTMYVLSTSVDTKGKENV